MNENFGSRRYIRQWECASGGTILLRVGKARVSGVPLRDSDVLLCLSTDRSGIYGVGNDKVEIQW